MAEDLAKSDALSNRIVWFTFFTHMHCAVRVLFLGEVLGLK